MASPMVPVIKGRLFWANRKWFTYPGLVLWTGKRHLRVFPKINWID